MGRRELRERIFTLLFRLEFNEKDEMPGQLEMFMEELPESSPTASQADRDYIQTKYESIQARLSEIDGLIDEKATGWSVSRMGKVDLTLLRLAVYEILYDEEVPAGVAINEAVELAKRFGQDESPSFINGVLAKFV